MATSTSSMRPIFPRRPARMGRLNSGIFVIRNCDRTRRFLDDLEARPSDPRWRFTDQSAFHRRLRLREHDGGRLLQARSAQCRLCRSSALAADALELRRRRRARRRCDHPAFLWRSVRQEAPGGSSCCSGSMHGSRRPASIAPVTEEMIDDVFCTVHELHEEPLMRCAARTPGMPPSRRSGTWRTTASPTNWRPCERGRKRSRPTGTARAGDVDALRGEVDVLRGERDALRAQGAALDGERDARRAETEKLAGDLAALRGEVDVLQGERDALRARRRRAPRRNDEARRRTRSTAPPGWLALLALWPTGARLAPQDFAAATIAPMRPRSRPRAVALAAGGAEADRCPCGEPT